jgi:hypothetical protein
LNKFFLTDIQGVVIYFEKKCGKDVAGKGKSSTFAPAFPGERRGERRGSGVL